MKTKKSLLWGIVIVAGVALTSLAVWNVASTDHSANEPMEIPKAELIK